MFCMYVGMSWYVIREQIRANGYKIRSSGLLLLDTRTRAAGTEIFAGRKSSFISSADLYTALTAKLSLVKLDIMLPMWKISWRRAGLPVNL